MEKFSFTDLITDVAMSIVYAILCPIGFILVELPEFLSAKWVVKWKRKGGESSGSFYLTKSKSEWLEKNLPTIEITEITYLPHFTKK